MDNHKKKLSIKDIAAISGVSIATVSRVLNNKGGYSKETEEKINA
ncbi:MAG: LacI family DNA-binding transcriptional regulator [Thomasclavelia ramosa]